MSNALVILVIVGVAGLGIAYLSNMLCEPLKLCYPPASAISATDPQQYAEGIAKTIGVEMPNPPVMSEEPQVPVSAQDFQSQFLAGTKSMQDMLNKKYGGVPVGGRSSPSLGRGNYSRLSPVMLQQLTTGCKRKLGPSSCWSNGARKCVPCGSTAAKYVSDYPSTFAEAEGYAPRVA